MRSSFRTLIQLPPFVVRLVGVRVLMNDRVLNSLPIRSALTLYVRRRALAVEKGAPPTQVSFETTSHCISHQSKQKKPPQPMPNSLFLKGMIDASRLRVKWVQSQLFGGPWLDKEFGAKVRLLKSCGFFVSIFADPSLLDSNVAEMLIDARVDQVRFCMDRCIPEVYDGVRVGLELAKVSENIDKFRRIREAKHKKHPLIWVAMVEASPNSAEIWKFFSRWSKVADIVNISAFGNWTGKLQMSGSVRLRVVHEYPCPCLWHQLTVTREGNIFPCSYYEHECTALSLGNIRDITLREAWEGGKLRDYRRLHLLGRGAQMPICRDCDILPIHWLRNGRVPRDAKAELGQR